MRGLCGHPFSASGGSGGPLKSVFAFCCCFFFSKFGGIMKFWEEEGASEVNCHPDLGREMHKWNGGCEVARPSTQFRFPVLSCCILVYLVSKWVPLSTIFVLTSAPIISFVFGGSARTSFDHLCHSTPLTWVAASCSFTSILFSKLSACTPNLLSIKGWRTCSHNNGHFNA